MKKALCIVLISIAISEIQGMHRRAPCDLPPVDPNNPFVQHSQQKDAENCSKMNRCQTVAGQDAESSEMTPAPFQMTVPASLSQAVRPKGGIRFSLQEDEQLQYLVDFFGAKDTWEAISLNMPGRSAKTCRERWRNYLAPDALYTKDHFTSKEDEKLISLQEELGPGKWKAKAAQMPGRSAEQCRHHWNMYLSKKTTNK